MACEAVPSDRPGAISIPTGMGQTMLFDISDNASAPLGGPWHRKIHEALARRSPSDKGSGMPQPKAPTHRVASGDRGYLNEAGHTTPSVLPRVAPRGSLPASFPQDTRFALQ